MTPDEISTRTTDDHEPGERGSKKRGTKDGDRPVLRVEWGETGQPEAINLCFEEGQ